MKALLKQGDKLPEDLKHILYIVDLTNNKLLLCSSVFAVNDSLTSYWYGFKNISMFYINNYTVHFYNYNENHIYELNYIRK